MRVGPSLGTHPLTPARPSQAKSSPARALLGEMLDGRCTPAEREQLMQSFEAFGADAIAAVRDQGTRIRVVDKPEFQAVVNDVCRKYNLDAGKGLPSGLYAGNTVYVRRDELHSLPRELSTKSHRHEFAHALQRALGGPMVGRHRELHRHAVSGEERPVTKYAATDFKEYFAESAAAFVTPRNEFGRPWFVRVMAPIQTRIYQVVSRDQEHLEAANPSAARELGWLFSTYLPSSSTPE